MADLRRRPRQPGAAAATPTAAGSTAAATATPGTTPAAPSTWPGSGWPTAGVVSCRYDRWRTAPPAELEAARRAYWAVAAGLHLRFAYVLTYLYDAQHDNHIHIDNGRSGPDLSTFRPRSRVQVQAVQAI